MGAAGSKKGEELATEPRKAFSDDDIFRHSSKRSKSKQTSYFSNQPLRPKSAKAKSQNSDSKSSKDVNKTPTNGKSSIWSRKSKRGRSGAALAPENIDADDANSSRSNQENRDLETITFRRLNRLQGSGETDDLWEGFEDVEDQKAGDWTAASVYRSFDCLNANSSLFQDPHLSRSFNPLVASKLPFMLSYELKPSLVAQLNSIKTPARDNLATDISKTTTSSSSTNSTNITGYFRQTSLPEPTSEPTSSQSANIDARHQVDVSRYLIDSKTAKRNVESPCNGDKSEQGNQNDVFHKELTKTLAKLVDKAGTNEYRKFCSMARAYSVDFSDVYIADFLESVETLAKLAKPVSTPSATPTASPYRRQSHNPGANCEMPKTPRTNLQTQSPANSSRRFTSDHLWKTAGEGLSSDRSATLGPEIFSSHKRASRIPIPIGTKMIQRNHKDYQSINFITSPNSRVLRNGYKHLPSVQTTASVQKEVLSAIEEVQEAGTDRRDTAVHQETKELTVVKKMTVSTDRVPSKCCCFCEESTTPLERMDTEILSRGKKKTLNSDSGSQFDVDFFYVDKDTKKPTMSFEEVLSLKRNKRMVQIQEETGPPCGLRPTSPAPRHFMEVPRSRRHRPISLCLLTDSSDRYVPVARLTIRKRCTCEVQMRRLCTFLESPGCCLAEATIAECSFEPAAILRLSKAIEVNESLKILNLESCGLEDDFAMLLGAALRHNVTLTRLSLAKNSLGPRGIAYLNQGLSKNLTLQDLNLDYNSVSDEGCKILSGLLAGSKQNKKETIQGSDGRTTCSLEEPPRLKSSLRKLSLKANKIGIDGASQVFLALRHVTNLTELDLSGNQVEDKSVEILGNILLFNRSLKILKLDNCGLTWRSCEFLRRPLKTNTDLSILSLDLNQLTDLGISYLAEGLQYNRNLKELSLNMCSVTSVGLESLVSVIKSRTALRTVRLCYNDISIADNSNAGFVGSNHADLLNNPFGESRQVKKDHRASQALHALDQCLRESQKNLLDESLWYASDVEVAQTEPTRYAAPPSSRHQGLSKSSFNSSLYRKMIMALKRNPSLRIVMWGNQRVS